MSQEDINEVGKTTPAPQKQYFSPPANYYQLSKEEQSAWCHEVAVRIFEAAENQKKLKSKESE